MVSLPGTRITDGKGPDEVGKPHPGEMTLGKAILLMDLPRKEGPHLTENRKENGGRKVTVE